MFTLLGQQDGNANFQYKVWSQSVQNLMIDGYGNIS